MSLGSGWFDSLHVINPHFSGYMRPLPSNSLPANFYFIIIFYYKNIVWFLKGETHFGILVNEYNNCNKSSAFVGYN